MKHPITAKVALLAAALAVPAAGAAAGAAGPTAGAPATAAEEAARATPLAPGAATVEGAAPPADAGPAEGEVEGAPSAAAEEEATGEGPGRHRVRYTRSLADRLARFLSDGDPWDLPYVPRKLKLEPPELIELPTRSKETTWLLPIAEKLLADAISWSVAYAWGEEWTRISGETIRRNLTGEWTFDPNDFATNQFGHPYHGHLAFSAWRAAGHEFWESVPFPIVMSTLWEYFAETEPPSINDGITTPVGGVFLGEVLYRLSSLVLDGGGLHPSATRYWAAGLISPTTGLTRALTGNRYRTRLAEPIPASIEARAGGSFSGSAYAEGQHWATGGLLSLSVNVTHGLPVGDWRLRKPFDHFDFVGSVVWRSEEPWIVLQVRGLLEGWDYGGGTSRGFWGIWGVYDMTTLEPFRVSESAVGIGTVGQWAAANGVALQGTALLAGGFGAAGAREASELTPDYHYGLGALAILEAKLIAADRGILRVSHRQYHVGGWVSPESKGDEIVMYETFGATLRVIGRHAVGLDVTRARRWAGFPDRPDTFNSYSQAIAYYAVVSDKTMGSGLTLARR